MVGTSRNHLNFVKSVVALVVTIVAFGFLLYEVRDSKYKELLEPIMIAFASVMVVDKLSAIYDGYLADLREGLNVDLKKLIDTVKNSSDLRFFTTRDEGNDYCAELASRANYIRNTVLKYGEATTSQSDAYKRWMKAKETATRERKIRVSEIVSKYLGEDKQQHVFASHVASYVNYKRKYLDDKKVPMVQLTLFNLADGIEVIFGWQFPGLEHGPCFASRDPKLGEYFAAYFEYHFTHIAT